jgi:hypothetical protein
VSRSAAALTGYICQGGEHFREILSPLLWFDYAHHRQARHGGQAQGGGNFARANLEGQILLLIFWLDT